MEINRYIGLRGLLVTAMMSLVASALSFGQTSYSYFNVTDGLSDNRVTSLMQLPDQRMLITTSSGIDVYDGNRFYSYGVGEIPSTRLEKYTGCYHLYVDNHQRLWIKNWHSVRCIDMVTKRQCSDFAELWKTIGVRDSVEDLFVDSYVRHLWVVSGNTLIEAETGKRYSVGDEGVILDVEVMDGLVYLFMSNGTLCCMSVKGGDDGFSITSDIGNALTSMVVPDTLSDSFVQIYGLPGQCVLRQFSVKDREWKTLLATDYIMHTIINASPGKAYMTSEKGLWIVDLISGKCQLDTGYSVIGDKEIKLDMNTLCVDHQGGLWMGSASQGLVYANSMRDSFSVSPQPLRATLVAMSVNNNEVDSWNGKAISYVDSLSLEYDCKSLALVYSAFNYALPKHTKFRYRLMPDSDDGMVQEGDTIWKSLESSGRELLDVNGMLHLNFNGLPYGKYVLQVQSCMGGGVFGPSHTLHINVLAPWWQTPWAYIIYIIGGLALLLLLFRLAMNARLRKLMRQHREELLYTRIQAMMETLEASDSESEGKDKSEEGLEVEAAPKAREMSDEDQDFLSKAMELVKKNVSNRGYSVEQLARDLCMERTGLYKRLTQLHDQSPSLFIRSIKLTHAANLLLTTDLTLSEVAEQAGFCNASHLARLFQEKYGCKPGDYKAKSTSMI
ncbi:MAG: helix-turn-helix domain-containing protein [Bacteroidaceae bacterium]|nr:helix-turn-helix domain-containing protein [Bacteroidaceae bacterium]